MTKKTDRSRGLLFAGITIIAVGITLMNNLKPSTSLGIVLIGIGGLLFLAAILARKKEVEENRKQ